MKFSYPLSNNVKLNFAPLDCDSQWRAEVGFADICVDIKNGERPQIRVASNQAMFNITNYASFTSIEFTGEDQLVVDEAVSGNSYCDYGAYPIQKCKFAKKPTSVVEKINM